MIPLAGSREPKPAAASGGCRQAERWKSQGAPNEARLCEFPGLAPLVGFGAKPQRPPSRSAPENVQFQSRLRSSLRLKRVIPARPGFPAGRRPRLFAAFSEEGIHAQRARRQATQSSVSPRAAGLFWQRYEQPERLKPVSIVGRKAACSETTFSLKSMGTAIPIPLPGAPPRTPPGT